MNAKHLLSLIAVASICGSTLKADIYCDDFRRRYGASTHIMQTPHFYNKASAHDTREEMVEPMQHGMRSQIAAEMMHDETDVVKELEIVEEEVED